MSFLFGSKSQQTGTAQSPGDYWLQTLLQPNLYQMRDRAYYSVPMWKVTEAPEAPGVARGYDIPEPYGVPSYSSAQMPYSSPTDYLTRGEMDTARNVMENFYGTGGGGSARGGGSGAGFDMEAALASDLAQGAMSRYMQARLPYDTMETQAARDIWGGRLGREQDVWEAQLGLGRDIFGAQNQMNVLGYQGDMAQYGYEQQTYDPRWMLSMYPGSTGSPIVQPGQTSFFSNPLNLMMTYGMGKDFGWWGG
ncbi:MAG: hypothetical protein ACFFCW_00410 [Candidatus Hodarchaeota archaeon]